MPSSNRRVRNSPGSIIEGALAMLAVFAADNRGPNGFCFLAGEKAWEEIAAIQAKLSLSPVDPATLTNLSIDGIPVYKSSELSADGFLLCRSIEWETVLT
jgi:hypothetical protein